MCFNIKAKSIFAATQSGQLMRGKNKQTNNYIFPKENYKQF